MHNAVAVYRWKGDPVKLRGINFGPVWGASGVQGFFGEGYWFHVLLKLVGLVFHGMTFVAKTTTYLKQLGNMAMNTDGITPAHWFPDCVVTRLRSGAALNAIGLSGPGVQALLDTGRWQTRTEPFFISFMSVAPTSGERLGEVRAFAEMLEDRLPEFHPGVLGLQWNVSCPNVGVHSEDLVNEVSNGLDMLGGLGIPVLVKLSVTVSVSIACEIGKHPACDGVVVSNTIPWKVVDPALKMQLFGSERSPLEKYNGGGLSGAPLLPLVIKWVKGARALGFTKHINAGGGILHPEHVSQLFEAGADSVFLGSIAFLRPWRVRACIRRAYSEAAKRAKPLEVSS